MKNLNFRGRRAYPIPVLESGFKASMHELAAGFLRNEDFHHALSKGEGREVPVQDLFRRYLPQAFAVEKGEVVDLDGNSGPQLDLMIFDGMRNFAFQKGPSKILPAEALLVSVEVKSLLTKSEISSSLEACRRLKRLRPFRKELWATRRRKGASADDQKARFFHCIFAYDSDLKHEGWLEAEYHRIATVGRQLGIEPTLIDRVYVANRGLINTAEHYGVVEQPGKGDWPDAVLHSTLSIFWDARTLEGNQYRIWNTQGK